MIDFKAEIRAAMKCAGEADVPFSLGPIAPEPLKRPTPVVRPNPVTSPATPPVGSTPPATMTTTQTSVPPAGTQPPGQGVTTTPAPGGATDPNATAASVVARGEQVVSQQVTPQSTQPPAQQQQDEQAPQPKTPPPRRDPSKSLIEHAADVGTWAQENYLDLAAIPIGAALMLFGGKMGAVLGALAIGGGAYGLYDRFQNLNDMGAPIQLPKGTPPGQANEQRKEILKQRWDVMQEASANNDTWNRWLSDPNNAKFYQSLGLVHRFMPQMIYEQVRKVKPIAGWMSDEGLDAELRDQLHGRLGGDEG